MTEFLVVPSALILATSAVSVQTGLSHKHCARRIHPVCCCKVPLCTTVIGLFSYKKYAILIETVIIINEGIVLDHFLGDGFIGNG